LQRTRGKQRKGEEGRSGIFWDFQEGEKKKEKESKSDDNERFLGMEKERREDGGRIEVKVEGS
jgi:hypothetical protein